MPVHSSIDVENPKQTIQSCFIMTHYVVPAFQREYVWGDTEIEQLLGDIIEAFQHDSNKEYFLGTTVVYKSDGKLQLIDGQQRMTTFFLVLCAIAKRYLEIGESPSAYESLIKTSTVDSLGRAVNLYSLELQYENSTKCLANVWEDNIPEETKDLPASNKRIYEAYNTIATHLRNDFSDKTEFMRFGWFFLNKVVFIQIGATNMSDALKIFETINQRGVTLNPMDLLKNMLFMQVRESQFDILNSKWKTMIDILEKKEEKPLRFLRYYITATYDISDVKQDFQGIINEDEIYNWLSRNNDKCHYKEAPIEFTDNMIDGLNRYISYLNPDDDMEGREYLKNIKSIMGQSYRLHLVPLLSAKGMNAHLRARLFKLFDSVVYYAVVNNIKSNTIERLFSSWCPAIRSISNESQLDDFINNKVVPTVDNWNLSYKQNFMGLALGSLQKYKIKAIIARIAKYIDAYRNNEQNLADISDYLKTSNEIEHIMPSTYTDISDFGFNEVDDYNAYKNRLGNLTLLEKTLNATIQNNTFSGKKEAYDQSGFYLTKSINGLIDVGTDTAINRMNRKLKSWSSWSADSIEERQEVLYELSKDIWDIKKA